MRVLNIHEREMPVLSSELGFLLDSLATEHDSLWPKENWPAMRFDQPLCVGAAGGHGPVRYVVEEYEPGRLVKFCFTGPSGFVGHHWFIVIPPSANGAVLRHTIDMRIEGWARLTWPLIFRPLHDALIEDSLACAQASVGLAPRVTSWSFWVKLLRWLLSGGKTRHQVAPRTIQS